jgi:flagellar protein FliJ
MKGYKFKLEALLKMRKLKEDQCKMEIGRLQVEVKKIEDEIGAHNKSIDEAYQSQETILQNGAGGHELQFYPYFIQGKKNHIRKLEEKKIYWQKVVNQKFEELKMLRANVKVIEQLKEKDQITYKKQIDKKMHEKIEEQVQNWRASQK